MEIVGIILLIIFIIASILLVVMVLIQDEQGEGLGGIFGGGSSTSFGPRSGNILTKATTILGAIFLVCSFALAWINKTPETGDVLGAARKSTDTEQTEKWWVPEEEGEDNQPSEEGE